jgi:hypothetical protein
VAIALNHRAETDEEISVKLKTGDLPTFSAKIRL